MVTLHRQMCTQKRACMTVICLSRGFVTVCSVEAAINFQVKRADNPSHGVQGEDLHHTKFGEKRFFLLRCCFLEIKDTNQPELPIKTTS